MRVVLSGPVAAIAVAATALLAAGCASSAGDHASHAGGRDGSGRPPATTRSEAPSNSHQKEMVHSGVVIPPKADLLAVGQSRSGPHVIAHTTSNQAVTITANLIPTVKPPNQTFKVYTVLARRNLFITAPRASDRGNVLAASTTITTHGGRVRRISLTTPAGLRPGTYYVIGVLDWFQHLPGGASANGQIQPLIGLLQVSAH